MASLIRLFAFGCVLWPFVAASAMSGSVMVKEGQPGAERYKGTDYLFLGHQDIAVTFHVEPRDDYALELFWGSKNDQRGIVVELDGLHAAQYASGGYDGFHWRRIPLGQRFGGEQTTIHLKAWGPKAAFIAGARLVCAGAPLLRCHSPAQPTPEPFGAPATIAAVPSTPVAPIPLRHFSSPFERAAWHGECAQEALRRSLHMTRAWLELADPTTGLIPRNLRQPQWLPNDNAADTFPFLALTTWFTDRPLYESTIRNMLASEQKHTNRLDRLADTFDFPTQRYAHDTIDLDRIIFGNAEYVKDGLLMIVEATGRDSVWMQRMIGIVDDIWKHAAIETHFGNIPSTNVEVNGELLQAMSRLYFATNDDKYLDWAVRLGDYYLLGDRHPTRHITHLSLRDHGCEIISGLCELYVALHFARPQKKDEYRPHIHEMLDRILEVGVNEHGMMYVWVNPQTGANSGDLSDTWGYNYNGIYSVYLVDGKEAYRDACRNALAHLNRHYRSYPWHPPHVLADGYADSIEGALGLLSFEPDASAFQWVDSEIRKMWAIQREDGIVEGWHGDGNFARTSIMYALWKTQGTTIHPWRADVRWGAAREDDALYLSIEAGDEPWSGKLHFESARHQQYMKLPLHYPRINHLPQWFPVEAERQYELHWLDSGQTLTCKGAQLLQGIDVSVEANQQRRFTLKTAP